MTKSWEGESVAHDEVLGRNACLNYSSPIGALEIVIATLSFDKVAKVGESRGLI